MDKPRHGFLVEQENGVVPAVGDTGKSTQMFCPLIRNMCMKTNCMFWLELMSGDKPVAHCAYYWSAIQLVDIKSQLLEFNKANKVV
jgi:hypothetical protein